MLCTSSFSSTKLNVFSKPQWSGAFLGDGTLTEWLSSSTGSILKNWNATKSLVMVSSSKKGALGSKVKLSILIIISGNGTSNPRAGAAAPGPPHSVVEDGRATCSP